MINMKTKEVAEMEKCHYATVSNWCKKNNIKREMGINGIMEYILTEKDLENFRKRKRPGGSVKKNK